MSRPARLITQNSLPIAELGKLRDHKFTYGHALVVSGGAGKTGAARLAARGALRIGAGLVSLAVPDEAMIEVASQVTSIMVANVQTADDLRDVLADERINALCLGPGLGLERARRLVPVALAADRPTVLDADALGAYEAEPAALFAQLHAKCVVTPHAGEFGRLFPDLREAAQAQEGSRADAVRAAAARAGCVVLLKGADTLVATPDGRCSLHSATGARAAPWLATAGSGDVLAGFITGLLARGMCPFEAAKTAVWLHVECALGYGAGLIAEDLPEALPNVFKALRV
ncbi:NAD(P)H-hydrate dehydratase [uncultured Lentibacter sp.]|uniref:NAD(P)H-hydrate dehydratase n=1 Tax=uncultured Lentibacter sp. TaxID=1659309 RepID=UPI003453722C